MRSLTKWTCEELTYTMPTFEELGLFDVTSIIFSYFMLTYAEPTSLRATILG
jgi:hypothetical protein